jgi:hypothetical protein
LTGLEDENYLNILYNVPIFDISTQASDLSLIEFLFENVLIKLIKDTVSTKIELDPIFRRRRENCNILLYLKRILRCFHKYLENVKTTPDISEKLYSHIDRLLSIVKKCIDSIKE